MTDMISRADAIAAVLDEGLLRQDLNAPTYADAIRALPAAQVADPATIRESALREALVLVRGYLDAWDDIAINGSSISIIYDAIRALIPTPPAVSDAVAASANIVADAIDADMNAFNALVKGFEAQPDMKVRHFFSAALRHYAAALAKLKGGA